MNLDDGDVEFLGDMEDAIREIFRADSGDLGESDAEFQENFRSMFPDDEQAPKTPESHHSLRSLMNEF
jgi:hypothetical protein